MLKRSLVFSVKEYVKNQGAINILSLTKIEVQMIMLGYRNILNLI